MMHPKLAVLLLSLLPASLLFAQNDPPVRTGKPAPAATEKTKPAHAANENDGVLANWLLVTNRNETALAQIAVEKAQSPEVKKFAQMVLEEHGQFVQKLQSIAGAAAVGARSPGRGERADEESDAAGRQRNLAEASGVRQAAPAGAFDHGALVNDLGKKCLASSTKMLNEKTGVEFDRCYMRMQVAAHVQLADMIEVFTTYGSESLRPTLEAGLVTVKAHLAEAKTLCKKHEMTESTQKAGPTDGK